MTPAQHTLSVSLVWLCVQSFQYFDIAGKGVADPASLRTAFSYAIQLRDAAV